MVNKLLRGKAYHFTLVSLKQISAIEHMKEERGKFLSATWKYFQDSFIILCKEERTYIIIVTEQSCKLPLSACCLSVKSLYFKIYNKRYIF